MPACRVDWSSPQFLGTFRHSAPDPYRRNAFTARRSQHSQHYPPEKKLNSVESSPLQPHVPAPSPFPSRFTSECFSSLGEEADG
jgi:hypothetical protein